jgi:hypothetical protein
MNLKLNVFAFEAKKMFFHKRGLAFVLIYLFIAIFSLIVFDKPQNPAAERNFDVYSTYLEQFGGTLTPEKEEKITAEYNAVTTAGNELSNLYNSYYDGDISEDEFTAKTAELESIIAKKGGVEVLFNQMIYARENVENRYILYDNGWNGLLTGDSLDVFLVLLTVLLITPIICSEYESSMQNLNMSVKKGGAYQAVCKILLSVGVATLLCILSFGIKAAFFCLKYGLPNGNYPLQSLSYFAESSKIISLIGAVGLVLVFQILGYVSFTLIILFIAQIAKKYAVTVFTSIAFVLLPYIGLPVASDKYYLPIGFMIGNGFLRGNEITKDAISGEEIIAFSEFSTAEIAVIAAITAFIIFIFAFIIINASKNKWSAGKKFNKIAVFPFCLVILCLSGCGTKPVSHGIWNQSTRRSYENQDYIVKEAFVDNESTLVIENKHTGEKSNINRDPLKSYYRLGNYVYGDGDYVYYQYRLMDNTSVRSGRTDSIGIARIDLRDFSKKIILEKNINPFRDTFLGLSKSSISYTDFPQAGFGMFVDDKNVYLVSEGVWKINRITLQTELLSIPTNTSMAFDGESIYYINYKNEIVIFNPYTKKDTCINGIAASRFFLTKTKIYFANRLDENKIYVLDRETNESEKLVDMSVLTVYGDSDFLYFNDDVKGEIYSCEYDGSNITQVDAAVINQS